MAEIVSLALPFFGLMFLGVVGGRLFSDQGSLDWLNTFIVYFALPALFFKLIAQTPFDQLINARFVIATTFATFCAFALAFAIGLTLAALGPVATVPTALIVCFDSTLMFVAIPLIMAFAGREKQSLAATLANVAKRVLTHPFIVATAFGIAAAYVEVSLPTALDRLLTMLSGAAAPCALFAMGVRIAQRPLKRIPREMPLLIMLKLVVHPLIVFGLFSALGGFDKTWMLTALLLAALPPAANVFVLAQQYEVYVERASSTIMLGTMTSVASVTALLYLMTKGYV